MSTLENRIERLERTNRRLSFALLGLSILAGLGASFAELRSASFDTVRARSFVVEDEAGNLRGIFGFRSAAADNGFALIGRDGASGISLTPGVDSIRVAKADKSVGFIR